MIVIAGSIPVKAEKREEAVAAALVMAAATQKEEHYVSILQQFSRSEHAFYL